MNIFGAEDAPHVRKGWVAILHTVPGIHVVGESDSVSGAIDGALGPGVDALLLDLQFVDGNGLDVLAAVKPQRPDMRVIDIAWPAPCDARRGSHATCAPE